MVFVSVSMASKPAPPRAQTASSCGGDPSPRDSRNPLGLAQAPGSNPLTGAHFFVDGPRHGPAAGAIASLVGKSPDSYPDSYSWDRFYTDLQQNGLVNNEVRQLAKIAGQPEVQRFSAYSQGGTPSGIDAQVRKILCNNLTADPGSVPVINTYFLHPAAGGCATTGQINAAASLFKRRIDAVASASGDRPAVYLLELDAIGSSSCFARKGSLSAYEGLLRYEVDKLAGLPHTVVYVEAGYSDSNSVNYTARALNAVDIRKIRGFYTNDTHMNWTINEVNWAEKISKLTHGAHYIVSTSDNGNGPKLNPHPVSQGVEDLCNPPGRALGPRPTTKTGFPHADAFLWIHEPGNSSGSCHGGTPSGSFWTARGIDLASHANGRLGPKYPSLPY
jgi:endoglucanase